MKQYVLILGVLLSYNAEASEWIACETAAGGTANCEYKEENGTLTIRGTGNEGSLGIWTVATSPWYGKTYGNIVIEDSIKDLGSHPFYGVTSTTPIVIPNSIQNIHNNAFDGAHAPEVVIPDSVKTIGAGAFFHSYISTVVIPDSVTAVGTNAFAEIHVNMDVVLSDGVQFGSDVFDFEHVRNIYCTGDLETCKTNVGDVYKDKVIGASKQKVNGVTYITDKNGNIIMKSGNRDNKRIYTVEEATLVSKDSGNTIKLRYK